MKYFLRILLVLVLSVAVVFGVYYANSKGDTTRQSSDIKLTTVTKPPVTEKREDKILLAEYDEGFALYKQEDTIILKDSDGEYPFYNWSKLITREKPTLYYADFDNDKEKELIFEIAGRELGGGKFEHDLYLLDRTKGKYGDDKYTVTLISRETWQFVLKQLLIQEMRQLECDKIVQFAMASGLETLKYNKKTGLNINGYGGYFKALQNKETGEYYRIKGWKIDSGEVYVDTKNHICCKVYINVTYHDTDQVQKPGYIYFQIIPKVTELGPFAVRARSMIFRSTDDSKVSLQHNTATGDWFAIRENSNTAASAAGDTVIDWVSTDIDDIEVVNYNKPDFSTLDTEIKNCVAIEVTNRHLKLVAKPGYTFDENMIARRDFSITINEGMPGDYGENEISYNGTITTDDNGRQVLEIVFDKSYPRGEIHTLRLDIPAK